MAVKVVEHLKRTKLSSPISQEDNVCFLKILVFIMVSRDHRAVQELSTVLVLIKIEVNMEIKPVTKSYHPLVVFFSLNSSTCCPQSGAAGIISSLTVLY